MQPWFLQGMLLPLSRCSASKALQRCPALYDDTSSSMSLFSCPALSPLTPPQIVRPCSGLLVCLEPDGQLTRGVARVRNYSQLQITGQG